MLMCSVRLPADAPDGGAKKTDTLKPPSASKVTLSRLKVTYWLGVATSRYESLPLPVFVSESTKVPVDPGSTGTGSVGPVTLKPNNWPTVMANDCADDWTDEPSDAARTANERAPSCSAT